MATEVWVRTPSERDGGGRNLAPMTKHIASNLPLATLVAVIALWYAFGAALVLIQAG
jgi:hypothetical protein